VTDPTIQGLLMYPFYYLRRAWGKVELYDVAADYREEQDLSQRPERAPLLSQLARTLDSIWTAAPPHPSRSARRPVPR
jgi:hypothetical protein